MLRRMSTERREAMTGIIFVNIATLSWATNIALGRYLRDDIGPLTLTAARYLFAAAAFYLLLRRAPAAERRPGPDLLPLLAMAATGVVLFAPLLYLGLRYTTAVNSTMINGTGPLLTAVFAAWLIKEPYSRRQLVGALAALGGVIILISGTAPHGLQQFRPNPGDLIVLTAAAVWGLYSVSSRRATRNRTPLSATALSIYMGLPVLLVAALIEQHTIPVVPSLRLLVIVPYLGLVPAAVGFSLWNGGVKKLGAGGAMVFYNMLPVYGTLLGTLFLGETIGLPHLAGGGLIIGGGLLSALQAFRSNRPVGSSASGGHHGHAAESQ